MNKFGVCRYEFDDYNPKIKDLEKFDTYNEAYNRYITLLETADKTNTFINKDLWIVYIDEYNRIVQFEQLDWKVKCRLIGGWLD